MINSIIKPALILFLFLTTLVLFAEEQLILTAPDNTKVLIYRDKFGVPHIKADNESALFFGEGFALAQDRCVQLELNRLQALGRLSEIGLYMQQNFLDIDKETRNYYYTKSERGAIYQAMSSAEKIIFDSFSAGINRYVDSSLINPNKYMDIRIFSIVNMYGYKLNKWESDHSIALAQYMIRQFGQFGGEELQRLSELQKNGKAWFEENCPLNDTSAYTTIPAKKEGIAKPLNYEYFNFRINDDKLNNYLNRKYEDVKIKTSMGIPSKFGSFAALVNGIKTNSNSAMLLGCPQMDTPSQNQYSIVWEVELQCPTLHVAGITVPGLPGVIIGRTEDFAWTFTSGMTDNTDTYADSTKDSSLSQYWYKGKWNDFEKITDTINVLTSAGTTREIFTHYRTVHGPVIFTQLESRLAFTHKMTFWKQELDMFSSLMKLIRAKNVQEFEDALKLNPMSFNIFYADKNHEIYYWFTGKYQDRKDGIDPRLPHKGDGSQEWKGFIKFEDLPKDNNPQQNYYVNWNNKPVNWWNNGDNIPWTSNTSAGTRVNKINEFVSETMPFPFTELINIPKMISSHGSYQQAIEFGWSGILSKNILPPGESYFMDVTNTNSPHNTDQWNLFTSWLYKDWLFGKFSPDDVKENKKINNSKVYPNPSIENVTLEFSILKDENIKVEIIDLSGKMVRTLYNAYTPAGSLNLSWDGKNDSSQNLNSGIYIYRITADKEISEGKLNLVR